MAYSRKKSREIVFRMLFGGADLELACEDGELPTGPELEYINKLYELTTKNLAEIDGIIASMAKGFTMDRIFKTDLTALRLGIAEMKYTDIQAIVAINEAVEIAKKYGTEKSSAFVNGILAKVVL
jgi:N utilization substance protein B